MTWKKNTIAIWLQILALILVTSTQVWTQIPEKFENLQVLPKDISQRDLINEMRSFARGLGVRCQHCHVGEGNDFTTYDFASDQKETKKTARVMLRMRNDINQKYLSQLAKTNTVEVNCVTCHHGQPEPLTLQQVLTEVISEDGIAAGIQKYHQLHQRYFGGFTYDFREPTLNHIGYTFLQNGKMDEAVEIFKLNAEMYPESFNVYDSLGEAYMKAGKKELAIANYEKSLELNKENDNAVKMLNELKK